MQFILCNSLSHSKPTRGEGQGRTMTPGPMDFRGPIMGPLASGGPAEGPCASEGAHRNDTEKSACEDRRRFFLEIT